MEGFGQSLDKPVFTWSNHKCFKIACTDCFPAAVKNLEVQKGIVQRMINFYISGKLAKGFKVCDLLFAAISIIPTVEEENNEDFIWPEIEYNVSGTLFRLTPEEKVKSISTDSLFDIDMKDYDDGPEFKDTAEKSYINSNTVEFPEVYVPENKYTENSDESRKTQENDVPEHKYTENSDKSMETQDQPMKHSITAECTIQENFTEKYIHTPNSLPRMPSNIKWYRSSLPSKSSYHKITYGLLETAAFSKCCNDLMHDWDTSTEARRRLKLFFGFIALMVLRATTKSLQHLFNTFSSSKMLISLGVIRWHDRFTTPHKRFIRSCHRVLRKKDGSTPTMFAKISIWLTHRLNNDIDSKDDKKQSFRHSLFLTTVLSHTVNYGLGLINMLQTVNMLYTTLRTDKPLDTVMTLSLNSETHTSWLMIHNFINKYMTQNESSTYHWARIINNNEFRELCCQNKENFPLAVILAVLVESGLNDPGVWQSTWMKGASQEKVNECKEIGKSILQQLI